MTKDEAIEKLIQEVKLIANCGSVEDFTVAGIRCTLRDALYRYNQMSDQSTWIQKAAAEITVGPDRCPECGWSLAGEASRGCVIGNCSFRPDSEEGRRYKKNNRERFQMFHDIIVKHVPEDK